MNEILVIPHVLNHPVKVREVEIASALAERFPTTVLTSNRQAPGISGLSKLSFHLTNLLETRSRSAAGATLEKLPALTFNSRVARAFNQRQLRRLIGKAGFRAVINAGYTPEWAVDPRQTTSYILDIVDNHWDGARIYESPIKAERIESFYRTETTKAKHVVVVSEFLRRQVRERWGIEAKVIPNGASMAAVRGISPERVQTLRTELGLDGKFVFGYIGGMDRFIDVETVNTAFTRVHEKYPDTALVWIGSGDRVSEYAHLAPPGVRFLGAVAPQESALHLSLFDAGLVPKVLNDFTHAMMPIKAVEYGAARIPVIASPLSELVRLEFPNTRLVPLTTEAWHGEMLKLLTHSLSWNSEWDGIFDRYDWVQIARDFEALF